MSYGTIQELEILGIGDPGVPNQERVALQTKLAVDLGDFLLVAGWRGPKGVSGFDVYYFGHVAAQPGALVLVYTGPGTNRTEVGANGQQIHIQHMSRAKTLFVPGTGVVLVKIAATLLSQAVASPTPVPQAPPKA